MVRQHFLHCVLLGAAAVAAPLPAAADQAEWLGGTGLAEDPSLSGTVVEQTTTSFSYEVVYDRHFPEPSTAQGRVNGSMLSRVIRARDDSYDFYWRVLVDGESFVGVVQFDVQGFSASRLRANWRNDLAGSVTPRIWLSSGGTQSFIFRDESENAVYPGQRSAYFFIDTDAREYAQTARAVVSSEDSALRYHVTGSSEALMSFGPSNAPVPEPQTWGLMLLGLAAVGGAAAKRRRSG